VIQREMKKGDVIQLTDITHAWYPCLMVVGEVKSWGVQACVLVPQSNAEQSVTQAWNRLSFNQVCFIGEAQIIPGDEEP
jgi:hypothetical protein